MSPALSPRRARILSPKSENILLAAQAIRRKELVGMPTETVYGLAGAAFEPEALTRIFETKERPTFDPLIIHVAPSGSTPATVSWLEQKKLVNAQELSPLARKRANLLIARFWPGPLTLVLPKNAAVPDLATSGLPNVAIRMPRHPVAQALITEAKTPLAAPSANRFGKISPTQASAVEEELGDRIDLILDGGTCEIGLESTVLQIGLDGTLTLLRPGEISLAAIQKELEGTGAISFAPSPPDGNPGGISISPGMLESHYAPSKPLFLLPSQVFQIRASTLKELLRQHRLKAMKQVGLLMLSGNAEEGAHFFSAVIGCPVIARTLSEGGTIQEAARYLFSELRALDQSASEVIFSEPCLVAEGLGHAIADRLRRASTKVR